MIVGDFEPSVADQVASERRAYRLGLICTAGVILASFAIGAVIAWLI